MRYLLLLLAPLIAACPNLSNEGITCEDSNDDFCPTGYWCDGDDCESLETNPPPEFEIVGFATDLTSDEAKGAADSRFTSALVFDDEFEQIHMRFRNVGGGQSAYPNVTIDAPCCLAMDESVGSNLIWITNSGETKTIDFSSRAWRSDCPSPNQFTVAIRESGRTSLATVDVELIEPADRNIAQRNCGE